MLRIIAWLTLFIILAFVCGLLSSAPLTHFAQTSVIATFNDLEGDAAESELARQFGINFPEGVTGFYRASLGNTAYWIQMQASRDDLSGLFRGSSYLTCSFPFQDGYKPVFDNRRLGTEELNRMTWWTPDAARSYIGGECTGSDYKIFRMFVDTSTQPLWTLYLQIMAH